ncbi:hypothetical protein CEXT_590251 [Caerostris extrusa]|uniref:Uncharacterized protein n=1 Tax=Caerostris extrusa TaxID=172846 RepID=A0AAV4PBI1_CAEEX|nr:hypothetical protein CEXT_590251 [Caerostris extrusa]
MDYTVSHICVKCYVSCLFRHDSLYGSSGSSTGSEQFFCFVYWILVIFSLKRNTIIKPLFPQWADCRRQTYSSHFFGSCPGHKPPFDLECRSFAVSSNSSSTQKECLPSSFLLLLWIE